MSLLLILTASSLAASVLTVSACMLSSRISQREAVANRRKT